MNDRNIANSFIVTGNVVAVGHVQNISEKFRKRELVLDITDNEKYPKNLVVDFVNGNVGMLDGLPREARVRVMCTAVSRQSKDRSRWFTSVQGHAVSTLGTLSVDTAATPAEPSGEADQYSESDDMPF